jgi:uncharacterized 2Fe-2S/4Fe-4S cluster protein (DUF4445 family)
MSTPSPQRGFTTTILHSDREGGVEHGALHKPLHLSVAYGYRDARDLAAVFQNRMPGYAYGRQGNPTTAALEAKVTRMEEGVATVCFATGMAAIGAAMLSAKVLDETGRIAMDEEVDALPPDLAQRVTELDGMNAFLLVPGEETEGGTEIAITQRDIRELQNAKAAIRAAVEILLSHLNLNSTDLKNVMLTGTFGSKVNVEDVLGLGMLPPVDSSIVKSVPNGAGLGAAMFFDEKNKQRGLEIAERAHHVELNMEPDFMDRFVGAMMF